MDEGEKKALDGIIGGVIERLMKESWDTVIQFVGSASPAQRQTAWRLVGYQQGKAEAVRHNLAAVFWTSEEISKLHLTDPETGLPREREERDDGGSQQT